jgi:hypothetical protein
MVRLPVFTAALVGVLAGSSCGDRAGITAPSQAPAPRPPLVERQLPPLAGAAVIYAFHEALENFGVRRVRTFTERSSFVLYESGAFALRIEGLAQQATGTYERGDEHIRFYFGEDSTTVDAIGTVTGHLMEVRYSEIMQHSDFENAVYQIVE